MAGRVPVLVLLLAASAGCPTPSQLPPGGGDDDDSLSDDDDDDTTDDDDSLSDDDDSGDCASPVGLDAFTAEALGEGEACSVGCQGGIQTCPDGVLHCDLAQSLPAEGLPGFLADPPAMQLSHGVAYAAAADEYLVTYPGQGPMAARLSACGELIEELALEDVAPSGHDISSVSVAYNPDRQEYFLVFRYELAGDPAEVYGRFFDLELQPLAGAFLLRSSSPYGNGFGAYYSSSSQRFLVRWGYGHDQALYQVVDADPQASPSLLGEPTILAGGAGEANGMKSQLSWSPDQELFLAVYAVEQASGNQANVYGRLISGDGEELGERFPIAETDLDETGPRLAYAPSSQRWLVTWQHRRADLTGYEVEGALVDSQGVVTPLPVVASSGPDLWDAPGPVTYAAQGDRFLVSWYLDWTTRIRNLDPHTGEGGEVVAVFEDAVPTALSARELGTEPQGLLTWTEGITGVYGGFFSW